MRKISKKKSSKKAQGKQKINRILIVVLVILFAFIVVLINRIAVTERENSSPNYYSVPIPTKVPQPTPTKYIPKNVIDPDTYMTYEVPSGWVKTKESGSILIHSVDFEENSAQGLVTKGIQIGIGGPFEKGLLDKVYSGNLGYQKNKQMLTIDGKRALSLHEEYEGYHFFLFLEDDEHVWQIGIESKDQASESLYQNEIDAFINSIRFIDP